MSRVRIAEVRGGCRGGRAAGAEVAGADGEGIWPGSSPSWSMSGYPEGLGGPPYDPRLMVAILLYGYTVRVRSSRAIEVKCVDDVPFRWLAEGGRITG